MEPTYLLEADPLTLENEHVIYCDPKGRAGSFSELPKDLQEKIINLINQVQQQRDKILKKRRAEDLFGYPIFALDKIAHWERISSPADFMINPFAETELSITDSFAYAVKDLFS